MKTLSPVGKLYLSLLLNLREMIRVGAGNSEEADALRDRMDKPWYAMTDDDRAQLDNGAVRAR